MFGVVLRRQVNGKGSCAGRIVPPNGGAADVLLAKGEARGLGAGLIFTAITELDDVS